MGLGRREFLRLSSIALAGISINPLQAVVTSDNIYINRKLGIMFEKPAGWTFVHVKDFGKLKNAQILNIDSELKEDNDGWFEYDEGHEDLGKLVREAMEDPVCIATKIDPQLPGYDGVFSPTITMHVTSTEETDQLGQSFQDVMNQSLASVSLLLRDFEILKEYEPYYICGSKFYEYDAEYLFEHIELSKPLKTELKVFKTRHNGFYYDFNCHQSSVQGQLAVKEFATFKDSIKLI